MLCPLALLRQANGDLISAKGILWLMLTKKKIACHVERAVDIGSVPEQENIRRSPKLKSNNRVNDRILFCAQTGLEHGNELVV